MLAPEKSSDLPEWATDFLASLCEVPNVAEACRRAGVTRQAAYQRRDHDPDFAAAWDDALDQSTDALVGEAYRRAREGVEEPVFYQGEECGRVRRYSDTLAIFLLKSHRPKTYGDRSKVEHSGPEGGAIPISVEAAIEKVYGEPKS